MLLKLENWKAIDVISLRNQTADCIEMVVLTDDPEKTIGSVFAHYDFVEAAGGIVKRKSSYLFIERHGLWDIPKGKMDKGETPEETAVREIEEECGIDGPTIQCAIGVTYHTYEWKGSPVLKKNYWFELAYDGPKTLTPQIEEAITKAVWVKKNEIPSLKENTYASIGEVIDLFLKK